MTAIILAGGRASRLKRCDKALIEIEGLSIIRRQLKILKDIFKEIIIVTNNPRRYKLTAAKVISDIVLGCGPLGGIYSGLKASTSFYNFVLACDMPFLNADLICYMIKEKNTYDLLIPKIDGKFHPLFGVYSKRCLPVIEEMLRRNRCKVSNIFPKINCRFILKYEIKRFDQNLFSLMNVNTQEELKKARRLTKGWLK